MSVNEQVGFCPFCRECFEGEPACPEHGLRLVPFHHLPTTPRELDPRTELPLWTLAHGRGWIALGALLSLVAFFLPLAHLAGDVRASSTLWQLADGRAKTLWLVPAAACAQLALLYRRRSLAGMRALRLSVLWLALFPLLVVALTWGGADAAARVLDANARHGVELVVGVGPLVLAIAASMSCWGAARLGAPRRFRKMRVHEVEPQG